MIKSRIAELSLLFLIVLSSNTMNIFALKSDQIIVSATGSISYSTDVVKGMFYGWNDGDDAWISTWLSTHWNEAKIRADFAEMEKLGVKLVRVFSGFEQCIVWDWAWDGGYQGFNEYIVNVDTLFQIAREYGMQIIFNVHFVEASFHWDALYNEDGVFTHGTWQRESYLQMWADLAQRYKGETGLYAFDLFNEVYATMDLHPDQEGCVGGSPAENHVTVEIMHDYLRDCYMTIKQNDPDRLVSIEVTANNQEAPIGSFYKYRHLIDDCVDYYQVGFYNNEGFIAGDCLPGLEQEDKPVILGEWGASEFWMPDRQAYALQRTWEDTQTINNAGGNIISLLPFSFVSDNIIDSITYEWKAGAYVIKDWS